jgi:predicted transposase/invertase (TIGR01784 family)
MQKAKVNFFKDRSLFYATFPIKEQAKKGGWNFQLMPVYFIAILDFIYDESQEAAKFRRDVCLKDQDGELFYDKLHFKFLQMPLFNKTADELATHFDKWLYFLKNLESFNHIPEILNEPIFKKGFEIAELAHLKPKQFDDYQKSLVEYWEVKNVQDTAFDEGVEKGKLAEKYSIAKALKNENVALDFIMKITGLTKSDIERL